MKIKKGVTGIPLSELSELSLDFEQLDKEWILGQSGVGLPELEAMDNLLLGVLLKLVSCLNNKINKTTSKIISKLVKS